MVTSTIPTILTPRVAAAHANGNKEEVQKAIGESIVISAMIGIVVTAALWFLQARVLALPLAVALSLSLSPTLVLSASLAARPQRQPHPNPGPQPEPSPEPTPL